MQTISLIGIILGVAIFVFCAFKSINLVISALFSSIVIFVFSQMPIMKSLTTVYMGGFSTFLKSYFLLFVLSASLGKILSDGGAAKKIAITLASISKRSEKNKKYLAVLMIPLLYLILSYIGITGFVIVFTVMPIGRALFEESDIPWTLYCYGGCAAVGASMLIGSLQPGNIFAMDVCKTSTVAGAGLSIVAVVTFFLVMAILIRRDIKKLDKKGEGFLTYGAAVKETQIGSGISEDKLPNLFISVLPFIVMIVLTAFIKLEVNTALFIGCVLGLILFRKNIVSVKTTISNGWTSAYAPVINVAATFAISSVIKAAPGFVIFTNALASLPPLLAGVGLGMISSFVIASSSSGIPAFGPAMLKSFTEAGLSAGAAHRMITISNFTGIPPHSPGITNASSVTKIPYSVCMKIYVKGSMVPGAFALIAALICIKLGLFIH